MTKISTFSENVEKLNGITQSEMAAWLLESSKTNVYLPLILNPKGSYSKQLFDIAMKHRFAEVRNAIEEAIGMWRLGPYRWRSLEELAKFGVDFGANIVTPAIDLILPLLKKSELRRSREEKQVVNSILLSFTHLPTTNQLICQLQRLLYNEHILAKDRKYIFQILIKRDTAQLKNYLLRFERSLQGQSDAATETKDVIKYLFDILGCDVTLDKSGFNDGSLSKVSANLYSLIEFEDEIRKEEQRFSQDKEFNIEQKTFSLYDIYNDINTSAN